MLLCVNFFTRSYTEKTQSYTERKVQYAWKYEDFHVSLCCNSKYKIMSTAELEMKQARLASNILNEKKYFFNYRNHLLLVFRY